MTSLSTTRRRRPAHNDPVPAGAEGVPGPDALHTTCKSYSLTTLVALPTMWSRILPISGESPKSKSRHS